MRIYVKAYKVVILENDKRMLEPTKLPKGEYFFALPKDFDTTKFDILQPENWRKYLDEEPIYHGMRLPHKTDDGLQRVHYEVYTVGITSEAYSFFRSFIEPKPGKKRIGTKFYLFPGYFLEDETKENYGVRKPAEEYGWIRYNEE